MPTIFYLFVGKVFHVKILCHCCCDFLSLFVLVYHFYNKWYLMDVKCIHDLYSLLGHILSYLIVL
jgi:hypothetical protein